MLETLLEKGLEPLKWLLIIAIAYTLAMTIWVFFETPVSLPAEPSPQRDTEQTRPPANVNWILAKHLFGEAGAAPVEPSQTQETSEVTRLPLVLQSVFVSDVPEESTAIVAQKGKPGKLYTVGDNLPGNAKLLEVANDRIFIRSRGARESLPFPQAGSRGFQAQPTYSDSELNPLDEDVSQYGDSTNEDLSSLRDRAAAARAARSADTPVPESIEEARDRFAEDPAEALESFGFESTEDGGYRVGNLAQSPFLRQSGLQSGDVILSVNGQPVGDLQQDRLQMDNILAQGSARIEVKRGQRRFFITAPIPGQGN